MSVVEEPSHLESSRRDRSRFDLDFKLGYRPELDGIRAIAVIMVLLYHGFLFIGDFAATYFAPLFLGVDIFFVLSGFLLTSLLFEERGRNGKVSFKGFYKRRALRLIPSLLFVLLCHLIYVVIIGQSLQNELVAFAVILTYSANYAVIYIDPGILTYSFNHTWSLSVEEQYYLFFFPILMLCYRLGKTFRSLLMILGVGFALAVGWRLYLTVATTIPPHFLKQRTDTRLDILLIGPIAAVSIFCGLRRNRWLNLAALGSLFGVMWFLAVGNAKALWLYQWGYPLIAFALATIIVWFVGGPDTVLHRIIRIRPLTWIGRVSYELYLVHFPIYMAVAGWRIGRLPFVVAVAASFAAAAFTYHFVARPFMKRKRQQALALRGSARPI